MMSEPAFNRNLKICIRGSNICYDIFRSRSQRETAIVFLPGLVREKNEGKSISLQSYCKKADYTFISADYYGVGRSEGHFAQGTVSRWTEDSIELIERVLDTKRERIFLFGHGLGAWISFLIAVRRPDLVRGIVGVSADPDFTEELLWKQLSDEVKHKIMQDGVCEITWGQEKYPITRSLIEDARMNLLLAGSVNVTCPVRLLHSLSDEEVPYSFALRLAENLASEDTRVVLMKGVAHEMEGEREFLAMRALLDEVVTAARESEIDLTSPGSG